MKPASRTSVVAIAAALALGAAGASRAQDEAVVTTETITATTYVNGGIGKEDQQAMHRIAREFPLRIEFSEHHDDEFVAGVPVLIADKAGNPVFMMPVAGPMLYVRLPDGQYRVTATHHGRTETQSVDLKTGAGRDVYFHWS